MHNYAWVGFIFDAEKFATQKFSYLNIIVFINSDTQWVLPTYVYQPNL